MKVKSLLLALLLVSAAAITFAAFPVQKAPAPVQSTNTETVVNTPVVVTNSTTAVTSTSTNAKANAADAYGGGKSQLVALLLCIFLGGLGIHRFYLGYTWQGVVQLLTAGGCGVWALIDLIRICTGDLQPKDGSYSKTL